MGKLLLVAALTFLGTTQLLSQPYVTGLSSVNGIAGPTTANNFYTSGGILNITVVTTLQLQGAGMAYAFFAFETFPASVYGCKVGVQVGSPASTSNFFLHNDNGADMGRMWLGGGGVETNSKCSFSINGSHITLSPDGTQYTVTLNIGLRDPYNGSKYVWVDTYDTMVRLPVGSLVMRRSPCRVRTTPHRRSRYHPHPAPGPSTGFNSLRLLQRIPTGRIRSIKIN